MASPSEVAREELEVIAALHGGTPIANAQLMTRLSFWDRLKMEFRPENVWHNGDYPKTYGRLNYVLAFGSGETSCKCCGTNRRILDGGFTPIRPWKWLVWRWFVALYLVGVFIYSITDAYEQGTWFYYLTNWQTTIFALYGTSALTTCLMLRRNHWDELNTDFKTSNERLRLLTAAEAESKGVQEDYALPLYVRCTWILHGLAMSCGIEVMIMFWSMLPTVPNKSDSTWVALSTIDHFSTIALVMVDFYFCAFPWLLLQFVWSTLFISVYTGWTIIHYNLGLGNKFDDGTYIYPPIDWSKPVQTTALVVVLMVVALPLVNLLIWVLSSEAMTCCQCLPRRRVPWMPALIGGEGLLVEEEEDDDALDSAERQE